MNEENVALEKLEGCISDIRNWMFENHLKLNYTKTRVLVIGNKHYNKVMVGLILALVIAKLRQ